MRAIGYAYGTPFMKFVSAVAGVFLWGTSTPTKAWGTSTTETWG